MARQYRKHDPVGGDVITANSYNKNWSSITETLNGTVDHLQVVTDSVGDVFTPFVALDVDAVAGPANQTISVGQFNTYCMNQKYSSPGNEETPVITVEQVSSSYQTGWNELRNLTGLENSSWLQAPCLEGMLRGTVVVDYEHRRSARSTVIGEIGSEQEARSKDWVEIGVFVDNYLVATTGHMGYGRLTVNLPWALPVGSQTVTVDVRWRAYFSPLQETSTVTEVERRPISFYNLHLWSRNQYR